jgi:hypothetical protein
MGAASPSHRNQHSDERDARDIQRAVISDDTKPATDVHYVKHLAVTTVKADAPNATRDIRGVKYTRLKSCASGC